MAITVCLSVRRCLECDRSCSRIATLQGAPYQCSRFSRSEIYPGIFQVSAQYLTPNNDQLAYEPNTTDDGR